MVKNKMQGVRYVGVSILIFCIGVLISVITNRILRINSVWLALDNAQISFVASVIEGAVSAIAAGLVLYQLKSGEAIEIRENEIREAEFYQHFINYWLETDKLFLKYPECRKYFYGNGDVTKLDPDSAEFERVMGFAEYFDDLFVYSEAEIEYQRIGRHSIPEEQINSYKNYMEKISSTPTFIFYREKYGDLINIMRGDRKK